MSSRPKLNGRGIACEPEKAIVELIERLAHARSPHEVFRDFVAMASLAISNAVDRAQSHGREEQYLRLSSKYTPDELKLFPHMLAQLTEAFERRVVALRSEPTNHVPNGDGLADILGSIYMQLDLGNARAGQFFTPYSVSRMMAGMLIGDGHEVNERGFLRVNEPTCGAGGMVVAMAESLHRAGFNYQQAMHATAVDIDEGCVHMAYLQLSLLHIPAVVVHANTLTLEVWSVWHTPAHVLGGWGRRLSDGPMLSQTKASSLLTPTPAPQPAVAENSGHASSSEPANIFAKIEQLSLF